MPPRPRLNIESLEQRSVPATLTVNSLADDKTAGDSLVTLREALIAANNDTATDLGDTGSGADSIVFAPSLAGATITLGGSGLPNIKTAVTITAPTGGLTVSANDASRVFFVNVDGSLSLTGLRLTAGNSIGGGGAGGLIAANAGSTLNLTNTTLDHAKADGGGAIISGGTVTIVGSTIVANTSTLNGGAITVNPGGTLSITNSTVSDNSADQFAGAIYVNNSTATITNSTVSGNTAVLDGGGIHVNKGTLTVVGSTFSGNTSTTFSGGAIQAYDNSTVTIANSTLSGNQAHLHGGAVDINTSTATLTNVTIVLNKARTADGAEGKGGGVSSFGTVTLNNTVVARNTAGSGTGSPDDVNNEALVASSANNFIGDASTAGGLTNGTNGNIVGGGDPRLAPLANNGGPTRTHAVLTDSPLIGMGSIALAPTGGVDQRGFPRSGVSPEIGAYEIQLVTVTPAALPNAAVGVPYSQTLAALAASLPSGTTFTFSLPLGAPPGLSLSPTGQLTGTPTTAGSTELTVLATASTGDFGFVQVRLTILSPGQFAVGGDVGSGVAKLLNPDRTERFQVTPFAGFTGGVRVASADFNGDGIGDLVAGTGPGRATRVVVLDGATQKELFSVDPFEAAFVGGVYVAAGDVTGDGVPDLIITPDEGGGPRARIFSGKGFTQFADFFGIDDANFRGGARATAGDVNGDGRADLIVVAGFGGGPRVAVFNGALLSANGGPKLFGDFAAFEDTLRNGIFVAAGDIDGDGFAEIIAGGGPGGGPRVSVFDGKDLLAGTQTRDADFFAGPDANRGGVRVATQDVDGDAQPDLLTGAGTANGSTVTGYAAATLIGSSPSQLFTFEGIAGFTGGVFVG